MIENPDRLKDEIISKMLNGDIVIRVEVYVPSKEQSLLGFELRDLLLDGSIAPIIASAIAKEIRETGRFFAEHGMKDEDLDRLFFVDWTAARKALF